MNPKVALNLKSTLDVWKIRGKMENDSPFQAKMVKNLTPCSIACEASAGSGRFSLFGRAKSGASANKCARPNYRAAIKAKNAPKGWKKPTVSPTVEHPNVPSPVGRRMS